MTQDKVKEVLNEATDRLNKGREKVEEVAEDIKDFAADVEEKGSKIEKDIRSKTTGRQRRIGAAVVIGILFLVIAGGIKTCGSDDVATNAPTAPQ